MLGNANDFELKILRLHWINDDGKDDANDLCVHGEVLVRIGEEIISDKNTGSWNLRSTGLYLLRTLDQNYTANDFGSQLLPCCGHFVVPSDDAIFVTIIGCPNGKDWNIRHDREQVFHTSLNGLTAQLSLKAYREMVLQFAEEIEKFYAQSQAKIMPDDDFDQRGYWQLWEEWKLLKNKWI